MGSAFLLITIKSVFLDERLFQRMRDVIDRMDNGPRNDSKRFGHRERAVRYAPTTLNGYWPFLIFGMVSLLSANPVILQATLVALEMLV